MSERYQGYQRLEFDYPHSRVLRISFDRPERYNALDATGHNEITYVWREVDADPDVDCVILTGKGKMVIGDDEFPIQAGDAFYVPFGEFHVTYNTGNQPLAMVWVTGKDRSAGK